MKKINSENKNPNIITPEEDTNKETTNMKEVKELFKQLIEAPPSYPQKLMKKCLKNYQQVHQMRKDQFVEEIIQVINSNMAKGKQQGQNRVIIPVYVRKNQEKYVKQYMEAVKSKIIQLSQIPKKKQNNSDSALDYAKRINIYTCENERKISNIINYLLEKAFNSHVDGDLEIYISEQITDFSGEFYNSGMEQKLAFNCALIVPTNQNCYDLKFSTSINPIDIFVHKQLFCNLLYKCICDEQVMGYLPKEVLLLIDEFDKSTKVTYKEVSHRLIYCLQRLQILREAKGVNFQYVEVKKIFQAIVKPLNKSFCFFYNQSQDKEEYVRLILGDKENVSFLGKYVSGMKIFMKDSDKHISDNEAESQLRKMIIAAIQQEQSIKHLASYLKTWKESSPSKGRPKKKVQNEKQLVTQLRQLIQHNSKLIKDQANIFKWQQFHFIEQLKSFLPLTIFDSIAHLTPTHHQLIQYIYRKESFSLGEIFQNFCLQGTMDSDDLMSYLRDLQLQGLIEMKTNNSKKTIRAVFFEQKIKKQKQSA